MDLSVFLFFSELLGTVAFAVSGVLVAKKQKLDLFGAIVLGVSTAVGGGVIRDLLLGNTPPIMFREPVYAVTASITSVIFFYIEKHSRLMEDSKKMVLSLNIADTIGLGVFAASGTEMAVLSAYGNNAFLAIFVGVITAVGGGILRDVLAGSIPLIMRKRVYAVAALAGTILYYVLRHTFRMSLSVAELISIALISAIRYLSIRYQWNLPSFNEPY